jgi:hypothetical protein
MRLFFLTIPKPLKQQPFLKKIIHSALLSGQYALRLPASRVYSLERLEAEPEAHTQGL